MYYILEKWTSESASVEYIACSSSLNALLNLALTMGISRENLEKMEEELILDHCGNVIEVYSIQTVRSVSQFNEERASIDHR